MLTPGNYKIKESYLIIGDDGSTQLELTVYGYPKSFTALFELVPVQSKEDRLEAAIRKTCIDYLKLKFEVDTVNRFIEELDTDPERWLEYMATNAQTGELELQRWELTNDVSRFLEVEV